MTIFAVAIMNGALPEGGGRGAPGAHGRGPVPTLSAQLGVLWTPVGPHVGAVPTYGGA